MKSEFKPAGYTVSFGAFLFLVCSIFLTVNKIIDPADSLGAVLILGLMFLCMDIYLVFGELRSKIIAVNFEINGISNIGFLGLFKPRTYFFDEIDGFKIVYISNRERSYEYLYLIAGDKKIIKLSEFYHKNYKELKREILSRNMKYLGSELFSNLREFKEIFV